MLFLYWSVGGVRSNNNQNVLRCYLQCRLWSHWLLDLSSISPESYLSDGYRQNRLTDYIVEDAGNNAHSSMDFGAGVEEMRVMGVKGMGQPQDDSLLIS